MVDFVSMNQINQLAKLIYETYVFKFFIINVAKYIGVYNF